MLKTVHEKLAHANKTRLHGIIKSNAVDGLNNVEDTDFFCKGCIYGKMHRLPYYRKYENQEGKGYDTGVCVCMELCCPMSVSLENAKYFMLVKDRKSSYLFVYFLKS